MTAAANTEGIAPGGDAQIAVIFRQMRGMLGLNVPGLARRLGTDISVVMDLEAGAVDNLPHWPETVRIIEGYGALTGVDQGPLVSRVLMLQTPKTTTPSSVSHVVTGSATAGAPYTASLPVPLPGLTAAALPVSAGPGGAAGGAQRQPVRATPERPAAETDAVRAERRERRRRRMKRGALLGLPVLAFVMLMTTAKISPRIIYATIEALPYAVRAPLRPGIDYLVLQAAPVQGGLRWVDAGNPRSRKADRLPSSVR